MEIRGFSFLILSLVVIFAILPSGKAVECYQCASNQKDCPSDTYKVKCPDSCMSCDLKVSNGTTYKAHMCAMSFTNFKLEVDTLNCVRCTENLCNNANTISTNIITAMGCFVLIGAARFGFA